MIETPRDGSERIPTIQIILRAFRLRHTPNTEPPVELDTGFIGRDRELSKILRTLVHTRDSRGSYLISGYRGSGKTSLINRALAHYRSGSTEWTFAPFPIAPRPPTQHRLRHGIWERRQRLRYRIWKWIGESLVEQERWIAQTDRTHHKSGLGRLAQSLLERYRRLRSFVGTTYVTLMRPVVDVRVNLAHDKGLDARKVLFNITALFYSELKRVLFHPVRLVSWLAGFSATTAIWYTVLRDSDIFASCFLFVQKFVYQAFLTLKLSFAGINENPSAFWLDFHLSSLEQQTDSHIVALSAAIIISAVLWTYVFRNNYRIWVDIKHLRERMIASEETNRNVGSGPFSIKVSKKILPLDERQIENALVLLLHDCRKVWRVFGRPDIIFLFDELDKIASVDSSDNRRATEDSQHIGVSEEIYRRKRQVDHLLGNLKNFITSSQARFFFIAGHEMLDAYNAERGSANSLYESLFNETLRYRAC